MATTAGMRAELVDASTTGVWLSMPRRFHLTSRGEIACDWRGA
jgi:hypothetical protein